MIVQSGSDEVQICRPKRICHTLLYDDLLPHTFLCPNLPAETQKLFMKYSFIWPSLFFFRLLLMKMSRFTEYTVWNVVTKPALFRANSMVVPASSLCIYSFLLVHDHVVLLTYFFKKSFRMTPPLFHSLWNTNTIVSNLPQWDIPFCKNAWKSGDTLSLFSFIMIC